jgi:hypothetical protein
VSADAFWDDKEMFDSGEFVKFENVGDTISGTITAIRKHMFDDGKVVPQISITTIDGVDRIVTAGQIRLKAALAEKRPGVGDLLTITLADIEKRSGGKTLKHFDVTVGPVAAAAPASPAAPAAADPLSGLTPEQIAAVKNLL